MTEIEIRSAVELPANRTAITLHTADGLNLVGELALPVSQSPVATLIMLHPLPTAGGFMDSHIYRKAANRLPALANIAVLRFNTRGTASPHGISEGQFDHGNLERLDVAAAVEFAVAQKLPNIWLVGWSFGTELALKYGPDFDAVVGTILLSPPLHRTSQEELARWNQNTKRIIALVPEHDDYLKPAEAAIAFSVIERLELIPVDDAKHLWVGETATKRVLNEIVGALAPQFAPLPDVYVVEN